VNISVSLIVRLVYREWYVDLSGAAASATFTGSDTERIAMAITIRSSEADRLAHELAAVTGESVTDAVTNALRERLERQRAVDPAKRQRRLATLQAMRMALAGQEVVDRRSDDEILGYNEYGSFD
jgi:antitoxin VapB